MLLEIKQAILHHKHCHDIKEKTSEPAKKRKICS